MKRTTALSPMEIVSHDPDGFQTVHSFGQWRIAVCNAFEQEKAETPGKRFQTDECFGLLEGKGMMAAAFGDDTPENIHAVEMRPYHVYNIPCGVWHAHVMEAGSKLMIVENADMGIRKSAKFPLSGVMVEKLEKVCQNPLEDVRWNHEA